MSCFRCSIGQANSAAPPKKSERACLSCGRLSNKLVLKAFCPSCWNRRLELVRGYNGKGAPLREVSKGIYRINAFIEVEAGSIAAARALFCSYRGRAFVAHTRPIRFDYEAPGLIWSSGIFKTEAEIIGIFARFGVRGNIALSETFSLVVTTQ